MDTARSLRTASWLLCFAASGCAGGGEREPIGEARSAVIYGADDREDADECTSSGPAAAWARSTAMIVATWALGPAEGGGFEITRRETLAESMRASGKPLCPEEPFQEQPVLGGLCSAFLAAPSVVVTAGHCVIDASICPMLAFVFGAGEGGAGRDPWHFGADDVYRCGGVSRLATRGAAGDYAVVRLDRPVVGRPPLRLRSEGKVADDEELILIGNPLGLTTKIAAHGAVLDNAPVPFFKASTDSYSGSSGSAVLGARSGLVEGILVRGEKDFVKKGDCWVSKVCPPDGASCRGEDVGRAPEVIAPAVLAIDSGPATWGAR
jgi:hypothetical protein